MLRQNPDLHPRRAASSFLSSSLNDLVEEIAAEVKTEPDDIRLGLAATETAVKQAKLDQYRIVYFATHGLVSGDLEQFANTKAEPALALTVAFSTQNRVSPIAFDARQIDLCVDYLPKYQVQIHSPYVL